MQFKKKTFPPFYSIPEKQKNDDPNSLQEKKETVYLVDIKHEIGQLQKFFFEENCLIADN